MRWMDLESVIQSEVRQKEKNKYCMLTHIYGIFKKQSMSQIFHGVYLYYICNFSEIQI